MNTLHGDSLEVLKTFESNTVDALITDPPAGISFMGKDWDHNKGGRDHWIAWMTSVMQECLRVLKPGAHGLVWALPRTSHWTATALENAGFEVRDTITHIFATGFPKSLNISKQVCKQYECQLLDNAKIAQKKYERFPLKLNEEKTDSVVAYVVIQVGEGQDHPTEIGVEVVLKDQTDTLLFVSTELTDSNTILSLKKSLEEEWLKVNNAITLTTLKTIIDLKIWSLLQFPNTLKNIISLNGTSLKPANEHWILVRKPCSEKTVAANVMKYGTGGINIDGCRIEGEPTPCQVSSTGSGYNKYDSTDYPGKRVYQSQGRFPANLVLSHNEDCLEECTEGCAVKMLDEQSGFSKSTDKPRNNSARENVSKGREYARIGTSVHSDSGGASRFFYCAKSSKSDRNAGLEGMAEGLGKRNFSQGMEYKLQADGSKTSIEQVPEANTHPTVKSTKLMEYLITLITPPKGIILDPFMGSGSTGVAAKKLGFEFVGIEKEQEYFEIADKRISS